MTATADVRALPSPGRWRRWVRRVAVAAATVAGALAAGGGVADADQTVSYDEAGDAPHISVIGDSTLAGVRWYGGYGALRRFNYLFNAESCRRTIERSCISREGYRSENVISTLRDLDGELGQVLVVMSGYNDPIGSIDEAIETVVGEARRQGVGHVVWLSLRTSQDVDYSDPQHQSSLNTFREYNEQLTAAAAASGGYLQVADWATYSSGSSTWFEHDGVHLTKAGVAALTTFIADAVGQVVAGEDVSPAVAPWSVLVPGAEGERVTAVQRALLAAGIAVPGGADGRYGNDTMIAVAEYQRRNTALRETGAVDVATAEALGVYADPEAPPPTIAPGAPPPTVAAVPAAPPADAASATVDAAGHGTPRWEQVSAVGAAVAVVAAITVALRRRQVVARRTARRWARVHPATSPGRTVADLRRDGVLRGPYDHEYEDVGALADTGELPVT
jgi:peptidoglycan hydrolase-like protein with peptidoglycan-binding domain